MALIDCKHVEFIKRDNGKGRPEGGVGDYVDIVGCIGDVPYKKRIGTGGTRVLERSSVCEIWKRTGEVGGGRFTDLGLETVAVLGCWREGS